MAVAEKVTPPVTDLIALPTDWGARSLSSDLVSAINLSPRAFKNFMAQAETGDISAQCALFEEMERRDAELDGHLRTRKMGVTSLGYDILPGDESPEAEEIAEYARGVVAAIGGDPAPGSPLRGMRAAIFDALDAIPKGFSVLEIDWETSASEWRPARLLFRPQRWFTLGKDGGDGQTLYLKGGELGEDDIPLPPMNFIIHTAQARSGFLWNWSLLRACVGPFIMRQYGVKDWLSFAEVYGMPARVGTLPAGVGFDTSEARQMFNMLKAFGIDMAMLKSAGATVEILEVQRGEGKVFQALLKYADDIMTKAILGQLLTSGGADGGSYALGKVQNLIREDLLQSDALGLDETLTHGLLAPIVILNKGPGAILPRWHTRFEAPEDLKAAADILGVLVGQAGMTTIPVAWAHERFGIPLPEGGEPTLQRPAAGGMFSAPTPKAPLIVRPSGLVLNASGIPRSRVLPEQGLAWLAERRVATAEAFEALSSAGKSRAWFVTGLNQERIATCGSLLTQALHEGYTEAWFLGQLEGRGISVTGAATPAAGQIGSAQAQVVYNNTTANAFQANNFIKAEEGRTERPFGEWICGPEPDEICTPLCGRRAPLGGALFGTFWPPLHHNCVCDVATLSQNEVDAHGWAVNDEAPSVPEGAWRYNRGDAYYLESAGQKPRTEAGRADALILAGLPRVEE